MRKTVTPGLFIKCWIVASRCCGVIPPSSRQIYESVYNHPKLGGLYIKSSSSKSESDQIKERNELRASNQLERDRYRGTYKTSDFVVESFLLNFSNSSTRASNLVLLLHLLRSNRDKIPCLALFFPGAISIASASRSIDISIWHTGHSGRLPLCNANSRYCRIHSRSKTCLH